MLIASVLRPTAKGDEPLNKHTHVGVYGLILKGGRALLIKKGRGPYIGKYDLPGGKIEFGETQEDALRREIAEETGLQCKTIKLIDGAAYHLTWEKPNGKMEDLHHLGFIYDVSVVEESPIKVGCDGEDSLGAEWVDPDGMSEGMLTPFASKVLLK